MLEVNEVTITGQVDAIYFENPANLYKVMRIQLADQDLEQLKGLSDLIVTGQFALIHYETKYEFTGNFVNHPKYGQQFVVTRYQQVTPTSESALIDYFASERFKGIGPTLAQRIVGHLGVNAIELITQDADCLKQVKGLTSDKRKSFRQALLLHQGTERIMMQLSQWGFGAKLADRIYQTFKSETLDRIKENPYVLVKEVEGIGFTKADTIAAQLDIAPQAIIRIEAALITALTTIANEQGDTYVLADRMFKSACALLEKSRPVLIELALLEQALDKACMEKSIIQLDQGYMLPSLYYAEVGIAQRIQQFMSLEQTCPTDPQELDDLIQKTMAVTGIQYDDQQIAALKLAINSPVSIITGGPGTGKTTLIKGLIYLHALVNEYELADHYAAYDLPPVLLAAPTGRAAKRMAEMANLPASTIHRLIGFNRETLVEDFRANQLEGQLLIVDECSMIDTWLMNWLWQAIPPTMQVVFVGDKDQLPSVGPGKVFDDLIQSQAIPTIYLEKIYRQQAENSIIPLAHAIRQGELPSTLLEKQTDRSFIPCQAQHVVQVVEQVARLAQQKGYTSHNMQVLAPIYKGEAGIDTINKHLQAILNPPKPKQAAIHYFDLVYRVGDKVLQLVNNPEDQVFNGDIGVIVAIYPAHSGIATKEEMVVSFEGREITYTSSEFDQLTLAYCCSIHKAQGSEYDLVVLPLVGAYHRMLRKDLLYTAVTRAKHRIILVGEPKSFQIAVQREELKRSTNLKDLLVVALQVKRIPTVKAVQEDKDLKAPVIATKKISHQIHQPTIAETPIPYLTMTNYLCVDPMIGMAGICPYDFIKKGD